MHCDKRGKQILSHKRILNLTRFTHKKKSELCSEKNVGNQEKDKQAFSKTEKKICRHALRGVFVGSHFLCPCGHSPIDFWH